jgi:N-acylneuraminate cytidylyltransferase
MSNLCIIPARGGSKRIPRKNIKDFLGKPIISYTIEAALHSNLFDDIIVSTDDMEVANIAIQNGVIVPFFRSQKNSNDFATTSDVLIEVLDILLKNGQKYDNICCLYPTAPFVDKDLLMKTYDLFSSGKYDSVFPIVKFSSPIQRALHFDSSNKIKMFWPENLYKRSQDLLESYHDAGQFYWLNAKEFVNQKVIFMKNSNAYLVDEMYVQDIDNISDWEIAEIKYKINKSNESK